MAKYQQLHVKQQTYRIQESRTRAKYISKPPSGNSTFSKVLFLLFHVSVYTILMCSFGLSIHASKINLHLVSPFGFNIRQNEFKVLKPAKSTRGNQIVENSPSESYNSNSRPWVNGIKNAFCSACASACSKTILQPIDAIKTIQQYYEQTANTKSISMLDACKIVLDRPGGFRNFYSGLSVNVIGAVPSVALYFGVYSYCKQVLLTTTYGAKHKTISIAVSAAIGNTIASFSRVPYEVLKQQLQTGMYSSTIEALTAVVTTGQFWNMIFPKGGIAIQMIRDVPYAVVTLLMYESLQSHFSVSRNNVRQATTSATTSRSVPISPTESATTTSVVVVKNKALDFLVGGIAGGIGSYVTNPMDVVKTRLQTNSLLYNGSVRQCTRTIWMEGGPSAFLRGSIPRLVHKVPANAFFFMFYELFRKLLRVE